MSATRDKSQKVTFVFSNFYNLYKKGKTAAHAANPVLKAQELSAPFAIPAVREHRPAEFIGKRIPKPPVLQPTTAIVTLRENLKSLTELHSRLKFMLQELEDLVK